jgi:integrase
MTDTRTGASLRSLSDTATCGDERPPRFDNIVFASRSGQPMIEYRRTWLRIAKLGDLKLDKASHLLRHCYALLAADLGYDDPTIAPLLDHKTHSITSR